MQLGIWYLWVKALHIAFMVTWFAGLFYLPRLFIYHVEASADADRERFSIMERRLFIIMTIGAALTTIFGLTLLRRCWRKAGSTSSCCCWPPCSSITSGVIDGSRFSRRNKFLQTRNGCAGLTRFRSCSC